MVDLLYVLGTIAFFGAMLGYARACERLGRQIEAGTRGDER
jgi:hypothetical protein